MPARTYTVPLTGVITIDAETGTVSISVDLTEVSHDLQYDYEYETPSAETQRDQQAVTDCLLASPSNFVMTHTMTSK